MTEKSSDSIFYKSRRFLWDGSRLRLVIWFYLLHHRHKRSQLVSSDGADLHLTPPVSLLICLTLRFSTVLIQKKNKNYWEVKWKMGWWWWIDWSLIRLPWRWDPPSSAAFIQNIGNVFEIRQLSGANTLMRYNMSTRKGGELQQGSYCFIY